jgi:hypothetical protein
VKKGLRALAPSSVRAPRGLLALELISNRSEWSPRGSAAGQATPRWLLMSFLRPELTEALGADASQQVAIDLAARHVAEVPKADIASHTPHSIHRLRLSGNFPFSVQNLSARTIEPHHGNSIPPQHAGSWKSCRRSRRTGRRLSCHRALLVRRGALPAAKPHRCAAPGKAISHRWRPVRSGRRRHWGWRHR